MPKSHPTGTSQLASILPRSMFFDPFIPLEAILPWEVWKDIAGHQGYEISSFGRVASYWRMGSSKGPRKTSIILNPSRHGRYGHQTFRLRKTDGGRETLHFHRLVLDSFSPLPWPGLVCRHLDGDPTNNHISNLRWGTKHEDMRDRDFHGTTARGERNGKVKLDAQKANDIHRRLLAGEKARALALEYGVTPTCINQIKYGKTWQYAIKE